MNDPVLPGWPSGKAGYAAIVGRPNVGKSTLLNRILDYRLAAVSSRPQTTRRHWHGIRSDESSQIVFIDTPGIHEATTKLGEAMLKSIRRSLGDADVVLLMCDPTRAQGREDELAAEAVGRRDVPLALVVNKADEADGVVCSDAERFYLERLGERCCEVRRISALTGDGVDGLVAWIVEHLPEGPFFYPPEQLSDCYEREIGAELIRESALELLREEVPHELAVEVESWQEGSDPLRVEATVYVARDAHKGIVIGRGGTMLKRIKRGAVERLREWLGGRVSLTLHVSVAADWRNRPRFLEQFGLSQ